jgi:hypothetical protein
MTVMGEDVGTAAVTAIDRDLMADRPAVADAGRRPPGRGVRSGSEQPSANDIVPAIPARWRWSGPDNVATAIPSMASSHRKKGTRAMSTPEHGPAQPGAAAPPGPLPFDEDRYNQMIQDIGRVLLRMAPAGWRRIDLKVLMVAPGHDIAVTMIMDDGTTTAVEPPEVIGQIAAELRARMYREGEGTWFGMRYTLDPPSDFHVSYNFDFDPLWEPPIRPDVFAEDVAAFPRDERHMPGWLREKLVETAAGSAEPSRSFP